MSNQPPDLPSPPFLSVDGLPNFRDAGGYPIEDQPGKAVRRSVLYRASEPSKLTQDGIATLQALNITHVYDLRAATEIENQKGLRIREWPGAERVFLPIFLDEDYSPQALAARMKDYFGPDGPQGFVRSYSKMLRVAAEPDHPYQPFTTILKHVASVTEPTPLLVHCTGGKDRTGVVYAVLLSLCGVADEAVAHEYSLTDLGLAGRREEFVAALLRHEAFEGDRAAAERMISARKENMLATLAKMRETYGSVEKYVLEHCRITADEVAQIRRNLIVDDDAPVDWERHARLLAQAG